MSKWGERLGKMTRKENRPHAGVFKLRICERTIGDDPILLFLAKRASFEVAMSEAQHGFALRSPLRQREKCGWRLRSNFEWPSDFRSLAQFEVAPFGNSESVEPGSRTVRQGQNQPKIVTLARCASEGKGLAILTRFEVASRIPSLAQFEVALFGNSESVEPESRTVRQGQNQPKIVTLARCASEGIGLAILTRFEVASRIPSLAQFEVAPFGNSESVGPGSRTVRQGQNQPKIVTLARCASEGIGLAILTRFEVASRIPSLAQRASVQSVRKSATSKLAQRATKRNRRLRLQNAPLQEAGDCSWN
ncbi:hypothetical protein M4951_03805 [Blastopirellula sp. J2-11]|uniref:hypothetical protein n=1 Tax=Blastopirellula sp. J2-11 TaxID=2943192 RepID=UPI0021C8A273|nr:hypothetical protein [Blastopirellula sp. J2-11]UUO07440.1 hypothetical protein M4951_03805 [Blastopirellula sp. J2-11]